MKFIAKKAFFRAWNSPTILTWASLGARLSNLTLLLPWILRRFTVEESNLWLLLSTFIGLQLLVDLGFSQTFSRIIAYANGGVSMREILEKRIFLSRSNVLQNKKALRQTVIAMRVIYLRIAIIGFLCISTFGSVAIQKPISQIADPTFGWLAWVVVVISTCYTLYGNQYTAYLMGTERVAILRRWEIATAFFSIASSVAVLVLGGGILSIIVVTQGWQCFSILRNWFLIRREIAEIKPWNVRILRRKIPPDVWRAVWPSAWRSGIGVLFSYGIVQVSGIFYAQFLPPSETAKYLLSLKIIQTISQFSQAPFYSKIPLMARLFAEGDRIKVLTQASKGMIFSLLTFSIGSIIAGPVVPFLLEKIGSKTEFLSYFDWTVLVTAFFLERVGAMHLQLYSLTNKILWHIANGVTGILMGVFFFFFFSSAGARAFPLAMFFSYFLFYCPYSMFHSYKEFGLAFPKFEVKTSCIPFLLIVIYTIFVLQTQNGS